MVLVSMEKSQLDILYLKYRELKKYKIINILLASILSLIGVVSITEIIVFLNRYAQVNILLSVLSLFSLTSIYSCICNIILEKQDNKIKNINTEIKELENNIIKELKNNKDKNISSLELRFDGLSKENKIKLLRYIQENTKDKDMISKLDDIDEVDYISLIDNNDRENIKTKKITKR